MRYDARPGDRLAFNKPACIYARRIGDSGCLLQAQAAAAETAVANAYSQIEAVLPAEI